MTISFIRGSIILALIVVFGLAVPLASAQQNASDSATNAEPRHGSVRLLSQSYGDSVVLRFGVTTSGSWTIATTYGYRIERVKMSAKGEFDRKAFVSLTPTLLKPWPLEQWKAQFAGKVDSENVFPAIAAQMIYGKSSVTTPRDARDLGSFALAGEELSDKFSFALFAADVDARAAEASGLRYVDRNVHLGESYIYRSYIAGSDPTYPIDTAYLVVTVTSHETPPAPMELVADTGDKRIKIQWCHPAVGGYTAYHVYRSEDGGHSYKRLTRSPVIALRNERTKGIPQYTDTNVVNYRKYRYQVRGITPFAELSDPAEVDAYSMDLTPPPAPYIEDPKQVGPHSVQVTWNASKMPEDLAGFRVGRSSNSLSGFHYINDKLIPKSDITFTDNAATDAEPYYIVAAFDTSGNAGRSIVVSSELIDSTPPSIPTGLHGMMDTTGVVKLRWKLGPESNIIGYRVLWANDPSHEFTQRTGEVWPDTTFTDTVEVRSLTPYVYYRVAAVNIRKNHSEMSPWYAVKRPDLVPPEASIFNDVIVSDTSAELHWAHSRSEDVVHQVLYRRTMSADNINADAWKELTTLDRAAERFIDYKVNQRTMYQYQIIVVDSSGNRSMPSPLVQARPYDPGTRPGVRDVRVTFDAKTRTAHLSWNYSSRPEDYWFTIYRGMNGQSVAQYRAVPSKLMSFDDPGLTSGSYTYAVRMTAKSGGQSPLSDAVTVTASQK